MNNIKILVNGRPASEDYALYINATGDYNYHLTIDIKGNPGTSNSSLIIYSYSKPARNVVIANNYQWFRKDKTTKNKIQNASNFYQCSTKDVGYHIACHITPVEEGYYGECKLIYGQIVLDPETETRFNKAKRENELRMQVEATANSGKLGFNMVDIKNGSINCLNHNLQKVYEMQITKSTNIVQAPNEPLKLKVFNNTENEINIKVSNITEKEVLMLFVEHVKATVGEGQTKNMIGSNINKANNLDNQSNNSINSIKNFFEDKRRAENPLKTSPFGLKGANEKASDKSQSLQYNRNHTIRNEIQVSANYEPSKTISEMDNILADYLNQPDPMKNKEQKAIRGNQTDKVSDKNFFETSFPHKNEIQNEAPLNNPKITNGTGNIAVNRYGQPPQHTNTISRPTSSQMLNEEHKSNYQRNAYLPLNPAPMNKNFNNIDKIAEKFATSNLPTKPIYISQRNVTPNNSGPISRDTKQPNNYLNSNSRPQSSNVNQGNKGLIERQYAVNMRQSHQRGSINQNFVGNQNPANGERTVSFKQVPDDQRGLSSNMRPSIYNEFMVGKNSESFMIEEGKSVDIYNPQTNKDMNALELALQKQRMKEEMLTKTNENGEEAFKQERAKLKKEIDRLKAANQSLLREIEFMQNEKRRMDDEESMVRNEKEVLLQQQLSKLNEKYMSVKKELTDLKAIFDQKDSLVQSTKESVFNLENSNFELKLENRKKNEMIEELKESNLYLTKKIDVIESEIKDKENLLMDKNDLQYKLDALKNDKFVLLDKLQSEDIEKKDLELIIDNLKASILQHDSLIQNLKQTIEDKNKKELTLRNELDDMAEKVLTFQRELEIKNSKLQAQGKKAVYESKYEDLHRKFSALEIELERVKEINEMINNENKRLVQELEEKRDEIEHQTKYKDVFISEKLKLLEYEKTQLENKNEKLKDTVDELYGEKNSLSHKIDIMEKEKQRMASENEELLKKLDDLMDNAGCFENKYMQDLKELQNMETINNQRQKQLETENKNLKLKIEELFNGKEYLIKENNELNAKIRTLDERLAAKQTEMLKMSTGEQHTNTTEMMMKYKRKIAELQEDYQFLQEENAKLRDDIYNLREEKLQILESKESELNSYNRLKDRYANLEDQMKAKETRIKDLEEKLKYNNKENESKAKNGDEHYEKSMKSNHAPNDRRDLIINELQEELVMVKCELLRIKEKNKDLQKSKELLSSQNIDAGTSHIKKFDQMDDLQSALHRLDEEDDNNAEIENIKYKLISIVGEYKPELRNKAKSITVYAIIEHLRELLSDMKHKSEEIEHMEKYIEEANKMILDYEQEKKEKDAQIEDLLEAKEVLLNNIANN